MKRLTINLPEDTHTNFKIFCASQGVAMSDVLAAFMADISASQDSDDSDERKYARAWFLCNELSNRW